MKDKKGMSVTMIKPIKKKGVKGIEVESMSVNPMPAKFGKVKELLGLKSKKK